MTRIRALLRGLTLLLASTGGAHANADGTGAIAIIGGAFPNGSSTALVYFGISPAPSGRATCNNHDTYQFVFDPNTPEGKSLYAALLTLQATGKQIWVHGTGTCHTHLAMEGVLYWNFLP